jgi:hypothetical protein
VNTPSRNRLVLPSGATIVVNRINALQPGAIRRDRFRVRRVYGYTVRDAGGVLVMRGRDLYGPTGRITDSTAPGARHMTEILLSAMVAASKRWQFQVVHEVAATAGGSRSANAYVPRFTPDGDRWVYRHRSEIWAALVEAMGSKPESLAGPTLEQAARTETAGPPPPCPPATGRSGMGPGL